MVYEENGRIGIRHYIMQQVWKQQNHHVQADINNRNVSCHSQLITVDSRQTKML